MMKMKKKFTDYQSVELPSVLQENDEQQMIQHERVGCAKRRRWQQWLFALAAVAFMGSFAVLANTTNSPLYSFILIKLGGNHHQEHHHHYHDKDFTKIVIIDKHSRGNHPHHHGNHSHHHHGHEDSNDDSDSDTSQKKNDEYDWKKYVHNRKKTKKQADDGTKEDVQTNEDKSETPFNERAGEIGGFINVNKTCEEAYSMPEFRDFGQLFLSLVGSPATRLSKHTYGFDFAGYPSVEYVSYNDTLMELQVVVVDGFDVFQAFHEVFRFENVDGNCRIYRTQYLILTDNGPITWKDVQAAGKDELTAMQKLFEREPSPGTSGI